MSDTQQIGVNTLEAPRSAHPNPVNFDREVRQSETGGKTARFHSRLSHKGMKEVHTAGQSVVYQGQIIPPGGKLPTPDELAIESSNPEDVTAQLKEKDEEIKRLQGERDVLKKQSADANRKDDDAKKKEEEAKKQPPAK